MELTNAKFAKFSGSKNNPIMKKLFSLLLLHVLTFQLQAQRTVLIESFTQASCWPCYTQAPDFQAIVTPNMDKIAIIKWHVSWPGIDPMYDYNTFDVNWRQGNFYGIYSVPIVRIGDVFSDPPNQLTQQVIDDEYAKPELYEIFIDESISGIDVEIDVTITALADWTGVSNLKSHVVLIEDEVHFPNPPGSNPVNVYHWVMRKMLPNRAGRDVVQMSEGQQMKFTEVYTIDTAEIVADELRTVVFIQNRISKEIHQVLLGPVKTGTNFIATCVTPPEIDTLLTSNESYTGSNDGFATVAVIGDPADYTFTWSAPNSTNNSSISGLTGGSYTVSVTDSTGCTVTQNFTIATIAAGIEAHGSQPVSLFPNPFSEQTTYQFSHPASGTLEVFDFTGKRIFYEQFKQTKQLHFSRNDLPSGVYFYHIHSTAQHFGKLLIE